MLHPLSSLFARIYSASCWLMPCTCKRHDDRSIVPKLATQGLPAAVSSQLSLTYETMVSYEHVDMIKCTFGVNRCDRSVATTHHVTTRISTFTKHVYVPKAQREIINRHTKLICMELALHQSTVTV